MPTVTISFWNLRNENDQVRTFAFKDAPNYNTVGTCDDFRHHELLQLLASLGMTDDEARALLETILAVQRIHRRQFQLTDEAYAVVSGHFLQGIP